MKHTIFPSIIYDYRKDWETLLPRVGYTVGNGRRVQFWKNSWRGETPLCTMFPSLFVLVVHKEASVDNVWDSSRYAGWWSPHFIKSFNDWEINEVERFLIFLHNRKVLPHLEDKLFSKEAKDGQFSMKFVYQSLNGNTANSFPHRSI